MATLIVASHIVVSSGAQASAPLTPAEMQKKMGLGINLGNRLDLYQQPNRTVRESFFVAYKQAMTTAGTQ